MTKFERLPMTLDEATFDRSLRLMENHTWIASKNDRFNELLMFCSRDEERSLVFDIVERYTYVDSEQLRQCLQQIAERITNEWKCGPQDSVIVAMDKSRHADSSAAIAWFLKPILGDMADWETNQFFKALGEAVTAVPDGGKIVIVDEFVGTGQSLKRALKWLSGKLDEQGKSAKLFVATVAAMEASKEKDLSLAEDFFSTIWMKKSIRDFYPPETAELHERLMLSLEERLLKEDGYMRLEKYSLGYKKSQSAYFFENGNPPNNNFPIFWWKRLANGSRRRPLTPRV
ncbi:MULTISPECIES: hypothetical protein [unclassified Sinorhizobium]|uniref:phosphoribosyltransferase-like protein n=1 Tax=unclassified Sinorhizobium TaxID=2613772 RepID=UPI0024C30F30|nr:MULTISPECIES: hypothetical protein [unclassified Sinorhizobium]MDK1377236.1 hypothetical protein [Sinorhizobium sp. 6-70]MDK1478798.1 hypothetical protein [Sinorhizobium sp. 6-117]